MYRIQYLPGDYMDHVIFLRVLAMPGVCAYAPAGSCMGRAHSVQPGLCLYCPGIGIGTEKRRFKGYLRVYIVYEARLL